MYCLTVGHSCMDKCTSASIFLPFFVILCPSKAIFHTLLAMLPQVFPALGDVFYTIGQVLATIDQCVVDFLENHYHIVQCIVDSLENRYHIAQ